VNGVREAGKRSAALIGTEVMARVCALLEDGEGAQVRTARGSWRAVVAVYSDQTLGTIRAEGAAAGGRFTILDADHVVDVRATQTAPPWNGSLSP
jgi:hypothetical protein